MGVLIDGKWRDDTHGPRTRDGRFVRRDSSFRNWVTPDGAPGPTGVGGFAAEPGRYHLYVSYACPWAHRTLIYRRLKGLEDKIGLSVVHWHMGEQGWTFAPGDGVIPDTVNGFECLHQLYTAADPRYTGRVTVPVLWDKERRTIVNNESADIIRMFDSAFDRVGATGPRFLRDRLRREIDTLNAEIYEAVNNGVYKAGFATRQDAYEEAVTALFATLDGLEARLSRRRYLFDAGITETDWRLFPTLVRFDAVYHGHFKCNLRRLADYPNLWGYTRDLYQVPGVAETVRLDHIKRHYYGSQTWVNPNGIVPLGPSLDFDAPHGRENVGGNRS